MPKNDSAKPTGKVPLNVYIIYSKSGCHSSYHRQAGNELYHYFARAYLSGGEKETFEDKPLRKSEEEDDENQDSESEWYIPLTRSTDAMGMPPETHNGDGRWCTN